ncbi:MAG: Asp-tRNA(Asn)/Glu-tRNA(Gln) amidotransferase subunit GatA [Eubacteriales bacterium]|nr:Asp-tRNA(Asn)/Glu-tRNA(Gln) amidotransferase subunit GatA [Eubacteriales bacterium]
MKAYELTMKQMMDALGKKELSAYELVTSLIGRIEEKEPGVKALNCVCADEAIAQAKASDERRAGGKQKGVFDGIPVIVKDNICTKGVKTTCSSKMLENFVPPYDAHVIELFQNKGIITLAKSNLDEFAMGSSTENSAFQASANPWDLRRVPGGSSGGSAAAVSAGFSSFALGSDTGGSIRQPASYCGVVGLKPTYGAVSRYGLVAFASSLDQIGPLTRTVEDAAFAMGTIYGYDKRDSTSMNIGYPDYTRAIGKDIKGMRIGLPKEYFGAGLDSDVKDAVDKAVSTMQSLGAIVEETALPTFAYALLSYYIISSAEATSNLSRYDGVKYGYRAKDFDGIVDMYIQTRNEGFGPEVKRRMMLGNYVLSSGYYDAYYLKALKVRTLIKQDFDRLFEKYDCILSPTAPTPAFFAGEKSDPMQMYLTDIYTVPVNIAGLTAVSVPCALSAQGLPIGIQLIARPMGEETMLSVAYALEQTSPAIGAPAFAGGGM